MRTPDLVPRYVTCERMRDAGFPQGGTYLCWKMNPWMALEVAPRTSPEFLAAPTSDEIPLPDTGVRVERYRPDGLWIASHRDWGSSIEDAGDTPVEARALLWLALNEKREK